MSADGHLLTNYRVVANGQQAMTAPVMVVLADESIPGTVIRSNDRGEVVALASGVVDSSGRRPGVYYLIPIDDALKALGIHP